MNKLFVYIFSLIFLAFVNAYAQDLPRVSVREMELEQTVFKQGTMVRGSALITNDSQQNIPDISYVVKLVGKFDKAGNPKTEYSSMPSNPFFLGSRTSKKINFEFTLPDNITGSDLGVRISSTLSSGDELSFAIARIHVDGQGLSVNVPDSYISFNNKNYRLDKGVVLRDGDTAKITFAVVNPNKTITTIVPVLDMFANSIEVGEKLSSQDLNKMPLKPGMSLTQTFNLPLFDYKPGIYVGVLNLYDSSGQVAGPRIPFRYGIAGNMASIERVTIDKEEVFRNDNFKVNIFATGNTKEMIEAIGSDNVPWIVNAKVYNEDNILIGESSGEVNLDTQPQITITMKAMSDAQAMRAVVTITKNEKILAEKDVTLSTVNKQDEAIKQIAKAEMGTFARFLRITDKNYIFLVVSALFMIFAISSVIIVIKRSRR